MKPRLLLFGAYNQVNFGDDLMAYIFAKELAADYDIQPVNWSSTLANAVDPSCGSGPIVAGIIGGGGFLATRQGDRLRSELEEFVRRCRRLGIPCGAFSIGGASQGGQTSEGTGEWLRALDFITVRTANDLRAVEFASPGAPAMLAPDVLFDAAEYLPERTGQAEPNKIGVNLSAKKVMKSSALRRLILRRSSDITFVLTVGSSRLRYEFPLLDVPGLSVHVNTDPIETLAVASGFETVLSDKLHFGLCAAVTGARFLAFSPPPKTRSLLAEHPWVGQEVQEDTIEAALNRDRAPDIPQERVSGRAHLDYLREWLRRKVQVSV